MGTSLETSASKERKEGRRRRECGRGRKEEVQSHLSDKQQSSVDSTEFGCSLSHAG